MQQRFSLLQPFESMANLSPQQLFSFRISGKIVALKYYLGTCWFFISFNGKILIPPPPDTHTQFAKQKRVGSRKRLIHFVNKFSTFKQLLSHIFCNFFILFQPIMSCDFHLINTLLYSKHSTKLACTDFEWSLYLCIIIAFYRAGFERQIQNAKLYFYYSA